jgi:hypothetical protein
LIRQHGANGLEIFFGIVLRREVHFLDGVTDHDQPTAAA